MSHRRMILPALALVVPLTMAAPILASGSAMGHGSMGHGPMGSPIIHQTMMAIHSLDLTDDQRDQIHAKMTQFHKTSETMRAQLDAAHKALMDKVLANPIDESAIRSNATTMARLHADALIAQAYLVKDIREALTADQRDQLDEALANAAGELEGSHDGAIPRHHGN